ncbi:protein YncP [Escherichia coli]|uniref:Protein YncP n=4 Tax=Escherichia coli TaxID=562 RepID=YNCP_ECOLI|nr:MULTISPECIES: protein YncP [Gammaproteobacteria]YP_010051184.1 protein YncP [Escherichia coli str. K-12 substr. MG1655]P0DSF2.1 RecName: Full=Protein YncP [Escherichia coli K-12]MED6440484.1 protein YncP [Escherichia coli O157]MBS7581095.1 hypothetical protein [Escherichia coli]MBU0039545.1 protein YncP [Escherichia coli]MBU0090231.1 protein YncP [Escherichia coli]MBU0129898.1 protein YncP [Escherichia coli]
MNLLVKCAGKIPALALTWTCRP